MALFYSMSDVLDAVLIEADFEEAEIMTTTGMLDLLRELHKVCKVHQMCARDMTQKLNEMESAMSIEDHTLHLKEK